MNAAGTGIWSRFDPTLFLAGDGAMRQPGGVPISALPSGTLPTGDEPIAIWQGGSLVQVPMNFLLQRADVTSGNGIDITLRAGGTTDPSNAVRGGNVYSSAGAGVVQGGYSFVHGAPDSTAAVGS